MLTARSLKLGRLALIMTDCLFPGNQRHSFTTEEKMDYWLQCGMLCNVYELKCPQCQQKFIRTRTLVIKEFSQDYAYYKAVYMNKLRCDIRHHITRKVIQEEQWLQHKIDLHKETLDTEPTADELQAWKNELFKHDDMNMPASLKKEALPHKLVVGEVIIEQKERKQKRRRTWAISQAKSRRRKKFVSSLTQMSEADFYDAAFIVESGSSYAMEHWLTMSQDKDAVEAIALLKTEVSVIMKRNQRFILKKKKPEHMEALETYSTNATATNYDNTRLEIRQFVDEINQKRSDTDWMALYDVNKMVYLEHDIPKSMTMYACRYDALHTVEA